VKGQVLEPASNIPNSSSLLFLAQQWQQNAPVKVKLCTEERTVALLSHARFAADL